LLDAAAAPVVVPVPARFPKATGLLVVPVSSLSVRKSGQTIVVVVSLRRCTGQSFFVPPTKQEGSVHFHWFSTFVFGHVDEVSFEECLFPLNL
jgi:hypothetical protein